MGHHVKQKRPAAAVVVGAVLLALCAVPVYWTAVLAYASFTGCLIGCSTPSPEVGVVFGALALFFTSTPFLVAAAVGRYPLRYAVALSAGVAGSLLLLSLITFGPVR